MTRSVFPVYVKLFLAACFWGGTFVAGRAIAADVGPMSASFFRFVIASAFLLAFMKVFRGAIPALKRGQYLPAVLLAMSGTVLYNIFFFIGLKTVPAGRAAVIVALNPVLIAVFSHFFFREHLRAVNIFGIIISVAGAIFVITRGHPSTLLASGNLGWGEFLIFLTVLSWTSYSLLGKYFMDSMPVLTAAVYTCFLSVPGLFPLALVEGLWSEALRYSADAWLSLFYLGLFGSALGIYWYLDGVDAIGPSRSGVFISFVPVSAIIFAFLILGEKLDYSIAWGGSAVAAGIFLTNKSPAVGGS